MLSMEDVLKRYFALMQRKANLEREIENIETEIARIEGMLLVLNDAEDANKKSKKVAKKKDD